MIIYINEIYGSLIMDLIYSVCWR